jgi:hypothetical protein
VHNFLVTSEVSIGHMVVMFVCQIYIVYMTCIYLVCSESNEDTECFFFLKKCLGVRVPLCLPIKLALRIGIHWQGKVYEKFPERSCNEQVHACCLFCGGACFVKCVLQDKCGSGGGFQNSSDCLHLFCGTFCEDVG